MEKLKNAAAALSVTVFIISLAVTATLAFRPLYYWDVKRMDIPAQSGYSDEEIRENYDALIRYNLVPGENKLEFPTLPMSREGEIHFREVKTIFQIFLWMVPASGILSLIFFLQKRKKREYGYLKTAGILTLGIPMILGILLAAGWDQAFVLFHEIVFCNDYWLFDPVTDPIITMLPDDFFLHCALMILALVSAGAALCLIGAARGSDQKKRAI